MLCLCTEEEALEKLQKLQGLLDACFIDEEEFNRRAAEYRQVLAATEESDDNASKEENIFLGFYHQPPQSNREVGYQCTEDYANCCSGADEEVILDKDCQDNTAEGELPKREEEEEEEKGTAPQPSKSQVQREARKRRKERRMEKRLHKASQRNKTNTNRTKTLNKNQQKVVILRDECKYDGCF